MTDNILIFPGCDVDAQCDTEPTLVDFELATGGLDPFKPATARQRAQDDLEDALCHFELVLGTKVEAATLRLFLERLNDE